MLKSFTLICWYAGVPARESFSFSFSFSYMYCPLTPLYSLLHSDILFCKGEVLVIIYLIPLQVVDLHHIHRCHPLRDIQ